MEGDDLENVFRIYFYAMMSAEEQYSWHLMKPRNFPKSILPKWPNRYKMKIKKNYDPKRCKVLALLYVRIGETDQAVRYLDEVLKASVDDKKYFYRLKAEVLEDLGRLDEALQNYYHFWKDKASLEFTAEQRNYVGWVSTTLLNNILKDPDHYLDVLLQNKSKDTQYLIYFEFGELLNKAKQRKLGLHYLMRGIHSLSHDQTIDPKYYRKIADLYYQDLDYSEALKRYITVLDYLICCNITPESSLVERIGELYLTHSLVERII